MYCSKCGSEISGKLNYCNICGGRLTEEITESNRPIIITLIISFGIVSIAGLGCLIGLIAMLLSRGIKDELIVILVVGYLFTLISILFILSRQISKFSESKANKKAESNEQTFQSVQLPAKTTAQLEEPKQRPFSVVDNTTKTFDESFINRK